MSTATVLEECVDVAVELDGVGRRVGTVDLLDGIDLAVRRGELVAIAGGSGAGKSTLLETMAGLQRPTSGSVRWRPVSGTSPGRIGFVPQDDIIHRALPLRRTLWFAARLRLPSGTPRAAVERVVDETLHAVDLADRAGTRVADLSGGQRKRASIAVELLARPDVFLLDEPTSGLDPTSAREVVRTLRHLADTGTTVVMTTHDPTQLDRCDRVVFVARGGRLAFDGTPAEARAHFGVHDLADVYDRLGAAARPDALPLPRCPAVAALELPRRSTSWRDWRVLAGRELALLVHQPMTLAIMAGSPVLVIAMLATMFRAGTFGDATDVIAPIQLVYWIAFSAFFFGLTFGLLQVVGELPVVRREHLAGVGVGAYVMSKVAVLAPVLAVVVGLMLGVLRALDRLPTMSGATAASALVSVVLVALAALGLGLLASSLVADAAQATLALPMLCFPQVLFAGAVIPSMAALGDALSIGVAARWGFESLGRSLGLDEHVAASPTLAGYAPAFEGSPVSGWLVLAALSLSTVAATVVVLRWRLRPSR